MEHGVVKCDEEIFVGVHPHHIDLNKKIMNAGGTEYKIKKVNETEIYGVVKNRNENFNIWFN